MIWPMYWRLVDEIICEEKRYSWRSKCIVYNGEKFPSIPKMLTVCHTYSICFVISVIVVSLQLLLFHYFIFCFSAYSLCMCKSSTSLTIRTVYWVLWIMLTLFLPLPLPSSLLLLSLSWFSDWFTLSVFHFR